MLEKFHRGKQGLVIRSLGRREDLKSWASLEPVEMEERGILRPWTLEARPSDFSSSVFPSLAL